VISLTDAAANQLRQAQADKGIAGYAVRVQVVGGGCEGFLYDLLYVDGPDPEDLVFEAHGQRLIVDPRSLGVIDGLVIDHGKTDYGEGFLFKNPRAKSQCSCGASFGV